MTRFPTGRADEGEAAVCPVGCSSFSTLEHLFTPRLWDNFNVSQREAGRTKLELRYPALTDTGGRLVDMIVPRQRAIHSHPAKVLRWRP